MEHVRHLMRFLNLRKKKKVQMNRLGLGESKKGKSKKQDSKVEPTAPKVTFKNKEFSDALEDDAVKRG